MSDEKESLKDRLMNSIKKQTIINGIKAMFKKYPQARVILPFVKDSLEMAEKEVDGFLGNADNIVVIGRKNGVANLVIINGKKKFNLTTGLNITQDKTDPAIVMIEPFFKYFREIENSGIFDLITEEDTKKFLEMKEKGFDGLQDMLKQNTGLKTIAAPGTETPHTEVTQEEIIPGAAAEITEHTEVGQEENIPAPETINPQS